MAGVGVEPKPSHLSGEYGAWFKDPLLAAAYPQRPPYPAGVIDLLTDLAREAPGAVLDIGCGTGELARRLAPRVGRVDAVDFSEAMITLGRSLPDGDAANLTWIVGAVEDVALHGPYALVSAGECLHWMDWDVVLPRFAAAVTTSGVLAIVGRSWDTNSRVWEQILPIIERHTPVRDYRPYDVIGSLVERRLFEVQGVRRFGPESWRPTIDEYLECRHSQRGLSRTHMGPAAVAAFDAEVRQAFERLRGSDVLARTGDRLELAVEARVTWGRPRGG
jgi:SAM-dependent methyltransferase